ncbi:50S ribosomal protein L17 [Patescibacteria group bacterium]|nr:50S ribosomal protein L17 [Patescibacteria group bacterium]MBU1663073.1 50S ribosomal protein L17 [Patescibacteria group bacterium]MBU1934017.1 50S ribosomal protein L17 [Patescibacteria group bacterium]MBU2007650.1 50S ribosomal protein L17 [Patescibacteria group bacterium]MBU2233517.1 50S ribosomal protein L17 [Patescibacteria group bacterium]
MRHRVKGKKLDRKKAPREAMLKNLASSIIIYEKVKTTEAKAKTVKPLLEKIITASIKGDLASRRELIRLLPQKMAVKKAMEILAIKYKGRQGGYSRIIKLGARLGDNANMVQIELV